MARLLKYALWLKFIRSNRKIYEIINTYYGNTVNGNIASFSVALSQGEVITEPIGQEKAPLTHVGFVELVNGQRKGEVIIASVEDLTIWEMNRHITIL